MGVFKSVVDKRAPLYHTSSRLAPDAQAPLSAAEGESRLRRGVVTLSASTRILVLPIHGYDCPVMLRLRKKLRCTSAVGLTVACLLILCACHLYLICDQPSPLSQGLGSQTCWGILSNI